MIHNKISFSCLFLISVIFIAGSSYSQAQQSLSLEKPSSLEIKAGVNDFHVKDEYLSPYIFSSVLFSSGISGEIISGDSKHVIDADFSTGSAETEKQPGEINQIIGSLSYSFFYRLPINSMFNINAGAGVSTWLSHSDFNLNSPEGGKFTDETWLWSHAINIMAEAEYPVFQKSLVTLGVTIPFFRVVSRPDNGHWLDERNSKVMKEDWTNAAGGGKGEFMWDNFIISANIEYTQFISSSLALLASYNFIYTSSDRPLPLGMYMNNIRAGLEILL